MRRAFLLLCFAGALGLLAPAASSAATLASGPWCGTVRMYDAAVTAEPAPTIQAFIAYPTGSPIDLSVAASTLQAAFANADGRVRAATAGQRGLRVRTGRSGCSSAYVDVVAIPLPADMVSFGQGISEIQRMVVDQPMTLWAGAVAKSSTTLCGIAGRREPIQTPAPLTPAHDYSLDGSAVATVAPDCSGGAQGGRVLLHELFHAMGAVDRGAPHYVVGGHVADDGDLMRGNGLGETIDIGSDDYFRFGGRLTSIAGTPLWNLADSLYLCGADDCGTTLARPAVTVAGRALEGDNVEYTAAGADYYRWTYGGSVDRTQVGPRLTISRYRSVSVQGVTVNGALSEPQSLTPPSTGRTVTPTVQPVPTATALPVGEVWIDPSPAPGAATLVSRRAKVTRGKVAFSFRCTAQAGCTTGKLRLTVRIKRRTYLSVVRVPSLASGRRTVVRVGLAPAAVRAIRAARSRGLAATLDGKLRVTLIAAR